MLRVTEGRFLKNTKTIVFLLFLLMILNLKSSNVFLGFNRKTTTRKVETSEKIFVLANRVNSKPNQNSEDQFNITLWITDWNEKVAFTDMNITVYDLDRKVASSHLPNETGHVDLGHTYAGPYAVQVQGGNRTVGYQEIKVEDSGTFTIRTWAYDLTVGCFDQEDVPLQDHVVFLYDQLVFYSPDNFTAVANQTGLLANWTKTDRSGIAHFKDVWNGTYKIGVLGGELIAEEIVNLQESEFITLKCNKTYLTLRCVTESDEPLSNATVYIRASDGHLIFRDYTDKNGYVRHEGIYLDKYKVFVEWMGIQVWFGTVDVQEERESTARCSVFRLRLHVEDSFGNALPSAVVTVRATAKRYVNGRAIVYSYVGPSLELETDERGSVSCLLPSATYEVSCNYGMYLGSAIINLVSDQKETIRCNIHTNAWSLAFFVASPLIGLTLLLERQRLRKPLEIRRYKNMLSKLESMYRNGQVEYRLYRKLREEYEARLMELGGREMR